MAPAETAQSAPPARPRLHVSTHPLVRHKVTLLSDERTDSMLFRALVNELTQLLVYEATADLPIRPFRYTTPMEEAEGICVDARIGLVPILRAGLGMVDGATTLLPNATVHHLGIYRDAASHQPVSYYNKLPNQFSADLMLLLDPMLATAGSASAAAEALKNHGATKVRFVGIIAAPEGVDRMAIEHPDVDLYVARLDRQLDTDKYIRPGLGDAGDRLFGTFNE
ncbi:MAG: uracil phosphoribosyltransferase [Thermomicrobiales bacterium]